MVKIIIVDDHQLVRAGIKHMLSDSKDFKIIGEASCGADAIKLARQESPDIVLLDLYLPDTSGLEVTQKILRHNPDTKIIIITAASNDLFPFRLMEAGARAYLTKDASKEEVLQAIREVASGKRVISPAIANQLALSKIEGRASTVFDTLSDREMEVVLLLVRGYNAKDIAEKMFVSKKTVHSYRGRIFEKLSVRNDVELTLLAISHGIVEFNQ